MNTVVHQRRVIGPGAMVGMGSVVTRDVPPFAKAYGNPCRVHGVNAVGMSRGGLPQEAVDFVSAAYGRGSVPHGQEPDVLRPAWAVVAEHTGTLMVTSSGRCRRGAGTRSSGRCP